ncbi:LPS-assembly protein LptD [Extensimonas sp. H3M7-6]|nr:LPS-assembly protein LptD [Extensimonas sp. H3M7-6]MDF1481159.1 LPS-assembly protein LptD [Extensimonas sp. H3M7-6]
MRPLVYALALAWCGVPPGAFAQGAAAQPASTPPASAASTPTSASTGDATAQDGWGRPQLHPSAQLQETLPRDVRPQLPLFVRGDRVTGQTDLNVRVEGNAELRRGDTTIRADRLEYLAPEDLAKARGQVHINRAGNIFDGTALDLRVEAFQGFFTDAHYRFLANGAYGDATRVDFVDSDRSVVHDATYTTCEKNDSASWTPDWILRAKTIHLDQEEDVGVADDGVLEFKGVPVLPIPHISFPLSDKRKSGFLPPTFGLDSRSGFEYSQPYYWNIAPNRDATFTGTVMGRRGVNAGGDFRYLESNYRGELKAQYMPSDSLRDRERWTYSAKHDGSIDAAGVGNLNLHLNLNRVSDNDYWRDFGHASSLGTNVMLERLLPSEMALSWAARDMTAQVRTLKWQTQQDINAPIVPPYDRMPQLQWRYAPSDLRHGLESSVEIDATRFEADRFLTHQPNADRSYMLAQVSRPFRTPGSFVTPRLQLNATNYQFDSPLINGSKSASRTVPTFSLDSGLVFERDTRLLGRSFVQTLEPRAFYTYTPYRDQHLLPIYDTAANDFNFATIYTENAYGGNDRIADNNLLTLGVTTRFLDPDTGADSLRLGIAQRLRFKDQNVTLPGEAPATDRVSDVLLGAGTNWTPQWGFDSVVQYNPHTRRSVRSTVSANYTPGNYRTLSAAYRMQRGTSEQIDLGWQWPLSSSASDAGGRKDAKAARTGSGRWYTVGRLDYSMRDKKLVDMVVGFEYDGCCWVGRVVVDRLQSSLITANTRLLFQIEFVGFSRLSLGQDPLAALKQNVPRYQPLHDPAARALPSRFSNYD